MHNPKQVAKTLLEIKAVVLRPNEPFTFASGIKSPIYCDNRLLMGYPEKRRFICDQFAELIKENNLEFDVVAGTAMAGIPHAAWLADKLGKPMIYIRDKPKDHGKQNLIEGKLENGQKVLVVEDLISTGGSSIAAVETARNFGGDVCACIAIFTYSFEKARQKFSDAKCPLFTLSNFDVLIEAAEEIDYITEEDAKKAIEWNKDPENWGKKMGFQ